MANFDFKSATPDTTLPTNGFLFGADSQSAPTPSIYSVDTVKTGMGLETTSVTGRLAKYSNTTGAQEQTDGLYEDSSGNVGIKNTAPNDALLHVGNNTTYNPSVGTGVLVSRSLTGSAVPHGVSVCDVLDQSVSGVGYAAFDVRSNWIGAKDYDHALSVQSFPVYESSGTISRFHGLVHGLTVNSGTVTTSYGIELRDATGSGTIGTQYGLYIGSLGKASTNWAIYSAGVAPSYFHGAINLDGILYAKSGSGIRLYNTANTAFADITPDTSANLVITSGATTSSFMSIRGASYTAFWAYTGGSWFERARITNDGSLGILTTNPTEAVDVNSDAIRIRNSQTPASAAATGDAGQICWDSNYIYVCVATNTWKRAALSTW